ncbi:hypothetical protein [Phocaeicola sp.]
MKKYKLPEEEKNTTVNEPQMAYGVDMKDTEGVAEAEETISKEEILVGIREGLMEMKEARRTGKRLKTAEKLLDEL